MDHQLLVFIKVAELHSFSRAAEQLHMTQPAVSQHIQALETRLGTKLLERTSQYVRLNKAGEIVYHHGKQIVDTYTRMQNLVDELVFIGKGELTIGASYTFGEYILPRMIADLKREYPFIKPKITIANTHQIADMVHQQLLDVGIVEGPFKHEKLLVKPFAKDSMYIVVANHHRLANKKNIHIDEVKNETWILREKGSGTRVAAESMFAKYQFTPIEVMEFGSTQIIKESVEAGIGISLLSQWTVLKEQSLGTLKLLQINGSPIFRTFTVIQKDNKFQPRAAELFLTILQKHQSLTFARKK